MKFIYIFFIPVVMGFNLIFYKGSHVPVSTYTGLINNLETKLHKNVTIKDYNPFEKLPDNTIIVSHSFGGSFALLDALIKRENVQGIVLLNSHFNSRFKMPYPKIDLKFIKQPVLTILGEKDRQLPIKRAIDDYFYANENICTNKHFIVCENEDHFSLLNNDTVTEEICKFVTNLDYYKPPENKYKWFTRPVHYPNTVDLASSVNILDAILKVVDFPFWNFLHYMYFLIVKPFDINYQYTDNYACYLKTKDIDRTNIKKWMEYEINNNYNVTWTETKLPSIHPSILVWLLKKPSVYKKKDKIYGEIIVLPIKNNITYYKTPNKLQFLEKLN